MKLLVIDNGTAHLDELLAVLAGYETRHLTPAELTEVDTASYGGAVMCGDYGVEAAADDGGAQAEMIRTGSMPLLAVCRGFELVCGAFGTELRDNAELTEGAGKIFPTEEGAKLLQGSDPLCVKPTKRWDIDTLPKSLRTLATSDSGIEAIRHRSLPVFGLQFFPSDFLYPTDAKLVYANILGVFGRHVSQSNATSAI